MTEKEQEQLFSDWLKQYKGLFFKIVRAYAVNAMDMDDLFQEIMINVWKSIPGFRQSCAVSTWVYRISINTALNWTRKEDKHRSSEAIETVQFLFQDQKVGVDERLTWLYKEIHQMDAIDRSIALLLLEGFLYREIAEELKISYATVHTHVRHIYEKLHVRSRTEAVTKHLHQVGGVRGEPRKSRNAAD